MSSFQLCELLFIYTFLIDLSSLIVLLFHGATVKTSEFLFRLWSVATSLLTSQSFGLLIVCYYAGLKKLHLDWLFSIPSCCIVPLLNLLVLKIANYMERTSKHQFKWGTHSECSKFLLIFELLSKWAGVFFSFMKNLFSMFVFLWIPFRWLNWLHFF